MLSINIQEYESSGPDILRLILDLFMILVTFIDVLIITRGMPKIASKSGKYYQNPVKITKIINKSSTNF